MNILITGGSGLIGRNLVAELSKNKRLNLFLITRNKKAENNSLHVNNIYHDLLKPIPEDKIPKEINIILHLAAIAHKFDYKTMRANCLMTKNITAPFTNKEVRFVFFSSIAVYGEAKRQFPIRVSDVCKPYSNYGFGKLKDEKIISSSFNDYVILRLCPVIDGEDIDLLKRVYLPKTKVKYRSSYNRSYSFLSHKTILNSIISIINQNEISNKIINLKDPTTYNESEILNKYLGREIKIPFLISEPIFLILNKLSFIPTFYKINCLLTKMLKTNTYE